MRAKHQAAAGLVVLGLIGFLSLRSSADLSVFIRQAKILMPGLSPQPKFSSSAARNGVQEEQTEAPRLSESYSKLPLSFEANQGQTDPEVKFLARGSGYALSLTPTAAVFQFSIGDSRLPIQQGIPAERSTRPDIMSAFPFSLKAPLLPEDSLTLNRQSTIGNQKLPRQSTMRNRQFKTVRTKLVGSNPNAQIEGLDRLPGISNYFIGNDPKKWRTNIPNYSRVQYRDVYPGISLVYYGNQRQLEYDWVVSPGADPSVIQMAYEGTERMEVDSAGDLVSHVAGKEIRQHKPRIYQERNGIQREVSGHYVLRENHRVGFQLGAYDVAKTLVIDPKLSFSTYLGGGNFDGANAVAVDLSGNTYVTGITDSIAFPITAGSFQSNPLPGREAIFVTKFNADDSLSYSTYLGGVYGSGGIAIDSLGNAYVTGTTYSPDFPVVNALQPSCGCSTIDPSSGDHQGDAFVTKLNSTGSALLYSTFLGGASFDEGKGIAVDNVGNAYIAGSTASLNFPTKNAVQANCNNCSWVLGRYFSDAFVTKINAIGTALIYSTYLGGTLCDSGTGIGIDSSGNAYVTGTTGSPNFPTASPFQGSLRGQFDAFVTKLSPSGTAIVYSSYLGGSGVDESHAIAVSPSGTVSLTGITQSADFPVTSNAFQPTSKNPGLAQAFATQVDVGGTALLYSTYLGGSVGEIGNAVAVDTSGNIYIAGDSGSSDLPLKDPLQDKLSGDGDAFLAKLNPSGSELL